VLAMMSAPPAPTYEQAADSQIWVGDYSGESFFTSHGVALEWHLEDPKAVFCPGDDTTDPISELAKIGTDEDAYSSYLYRNGDQTGSARLSNLGTNDEGEAVRALLFDRQTQLPIENGVRTNHGNQLSNLLFVDGHVTLFPNVGQANLFGIRGQDIVNLLGRLDEIMINGDQAGHAGAGSGEAYPYP